MPRLLSFLFLLLLTLPAAAQNAGIEVKASIAPAQARPNQNVAYTISVSGAAPTALPELRLPLQVQQVSSVSTSQQFQMINGVTSSKVTFTWALVGTEPGDFVIPAQTVTLGNQTVQSNEVQFKVVQGQVNTQSANPGQPSSEEAFLQLEIGKTEIYQGELVPLSAALYVPRQMGLRRFGLIDINKDDFAIQRFPQQAEQSQEVVANIGFNVFTFRSTISALRTGDLKIGPANQELLVEVMGQGGMANSPFGGFPFAEPQKIIAKSSQIPVKVIPLPTEGKPASFSGAVGDFTLSAKASPTEGLKVGDPISVELSVTGSGNFDALTEPKLSEPADWKTYPSRRFNAEGTIDPVLQPTVERTVNYSTVIVPQKAHAILPPYEIVFFSPTQKKYVVLQTSPIPLKIEAPAPVAAKPDGSPADASLAADAPPPAVAPRAELADILTELPVTATWIKPATQPPLLQQPLFWAAQSLPLLALAFAFIGRASAQKRARLAAGPAGQIRQAWSAVTESSLPDQEFLRRASQFLLTAARPDTQDRPEYAALLKRYADHNFAGPTTPATPLTPAERKDILRHLESLKTTALSEASQSATTTPTTKALATLALLLSLTATLPAQDPDTTYTKAREAFTKGKFKDTQYLAESLVKDPDKAQFSPELFELIGHARFRAGDLGRAALWYRRAQFFTPNDPELRQNLQLLDERLRFLSYQPASPLHEWSLKLSQNQWTLLAALGFWLLVLPAAWLILTSKLRVPARIISVLGTCILTLAIVFLLVRPTPKERTDQIALVTSKDTRAHSAAAATAGPVIDLPPGSATRILEVRGAWTYCEIPYQPAPLRGWVENAALTPLWPYNPALIP